MALIDWGQSIYHQCRAIVPNSSTRRASGAVLWVSAVWFYRSRWLIAPIDWGQSIYHADDAQRRRLIAPIDWGQSIYPSIKHVALPCASICQGTQASARSFTFVSAFRSGISVASSTRFSIE